jgi:hypothetical protein
VDQAQPEGARAKEHTTWPEGFDSTAAGVIVAADEDA